MDSNRNTVLQVIVLGIAIAAVLVFGFAGCRTGTETKTTQEPDQSQAQPQASEKVARLEKENAELREKVAKLEKDNETLVKIAKGSTPFPLPPAIETAVKKVDQKEKIIILPIGREDNVNMGMRFHVTRHGAYVGEVMVFRAASRKRVETGVTASPRVGWDEGNTSRQAASRYFRAAGM